MSTESSPTPARVSLGLLALMLLGPLAALNVRSQLRLEELKVSGVQAVGRITWKHCENHGEVFYAFKVDGKDYVGNGTCVSSCRDASVGDPVSIIYARDAPSNVECRSLAEKREMIDGNYLALTLIAAVLTAVIFHITRVDGPIRSRDWR